MTVAVTSYPGSSTVKNSSNEGRHLDRKRVLLADDHVAVLEQVGALLARDHEVVGTAANGQALVEAAQKLLPDVIVTDISMPIMNGFEAAAKLRSLGLTAKVIFLSVQSSPAYIKKARSLGASGYVLKLYAAEQLPEAIAVVLAGGTYISPELNFPVQI
jgi:DNA-binding NarL/FixJ family response regulator